MTLHASILDPGEWWACSEPERPGRSDSGVVYDERCQRCVLKASADLRAFGDNEMDDTDDPDCAPVLLSEVARGLLLVADVMGEAS